MARIHVLEPEVRDQIAAGEVVERPLSVVKEMIENSLDANARRIEIEVVAGGTALIAVRDDGEGILPEDIPLAVQRHATSKLHTLEDLLTGSTLGFRGEALAAIAAVSRLTLASRTQADHVGSRIRVEAGRVVEVQPQAMEVGTQVRVADLFYPVPARLKTQKSPATELGALHRLITAMAVGFPQVAFQLKSDGRLNFASTGRGDVTEVLSQAYGQEVAREAVSLKVHADGQQIRGWILPAHHHRPSRQAQVLFVNHRLVNNWLLRHTVEEAFRPEVPQRHYPLFWIQIEVPPQTLDPNAHPGKWEVRIGRERQLVSLLHRSVRDALRGQSPSPSFERIPEQRLAQDQLSWPPAPIESPQTLAETANGTYSQTKTVLTQEIQELAPLGQWQHKYIVAEGPLGLYLIDQHAAHERVYYEQFREEARQAGPSQMLLIPFTYHVPPMLWGAWQAHGASLLDWGFDISEIGGTSLLIRAVPHALADVDMSISLFQRVLEGLDPDAAHPDHPWSWAQEHRIAMAACKAAIKAYRPLSLVEIQTLLQQLARTEDPRSCPHGRPTLLHWTVEEMDRRFGRSG